MWLTGHKAPTIELIGIGFRDDVIQPGKLRALQALGQGAVLQYYNVGLHIVRVVDDFFQQQQDPHTDWPARSPDSNLSEHL